MDTNKVEEIQAKLKTIQNEMFNMSRELTDFEGLVSTAQVEAFPALSDASKSLFGVQGVLCINAIFFA